MINATTVNKLNEMRLTAMADLSRYLTVVSAPKMSVVDGVFHRQLPEDSKKKP